MYVCICRAVTDTELRSCIEAGARTVEEVGTACGAGTGCGGCVNQWNNFLTAAHAPTDLSGLPLTA